MKAASLKATRLPERGSSGMNSAGPVASIQEATPQVNECNCDLSPLREFPNSRRCG